MPRPSRPWFRFYVEAIYDRKLRRLTPAQRWLWVVVLAAARQSPLAGWLMVSLREPLRDDELADMAGMALKDVRAALPLFEHAEMIRWDENIGTWEVTNFKERQYESDSSTERTRKHRSKERSNVVPGNAPESEQSRAETPQPPSRRRTKLDPFTRPPVPEASAVMASVLPPLEEVCPMPAFLRASTGAWANDSTTANEAAPPVDVVPAPQPIEHELNTPPVVPAGVPQPKENA